MEIYTIQILSYNDIFEWTDLLNKNRVHNIGRESPRVLNIDMTNTGFIKPYHVVSLACLIEEYHMCGSKIEFTLGENNKSNNYFNSTGILNYWDKGFDRCEYHASDVKTSLNLWKIHPEMIHPYINYAEEYFRNQYFNGKDLQPLNTSMAELFNNVFDHSKSSVSGYVYTQYFPKVRQIVISLCDFGSGIPNNINAFLTRKRKTVKNDTEALLLALEKGFSTNSVPSNRGFGLDNISSLIKSLSSELLIVSNYGILKQLSDGKLVKEVNRACFPGTQVVITIDTTQLKAFVIEDVIENFELTL